MVIVECDERQHEGYDESCEIRRLVELLAACEGTRLVVVRWNPDEYTVRGMARKTSRKERLKSLLSAIETAMKEAPATILDVRYLFYDDVRQARMEQALAEALARYVHAGL